MLKSDDENIDSVPKDADFKIYKSKNEPYFQLIKYKGFGYDKNNDPEDITKKTVKYITSRDKEGNHNNFVHCIWFCLSGFGIEDIEKKYLKKLQKAYSNVNLPIIIVYLKGKMPEKMKTIAKDELGVEYIDDIITNPIRRPDGSITPTHGDDDLKKLTIKKINEDLTGNMQKIMMENIETEIKKAIINKNSEIKRRIKNKNINKFIAEFINVKNDYDFIIFLIKA